MRKPKVFLGHLFDPGNPSLARIRTIARTSPPREFEIVDDAAAAEIRLDVEYGYAGLKDCRFDAHRADQLRFLFCESDWPFAFMPGLYPSLVRKLRWAASWAYIPEPEFPAAMDLDRELLFSFVGRVATHPCRQEVVGLDSGSTPCIDSSQTSQRFGNWDYRSSYAALIARSHFVLCPRGFGSSSIRIFEAMRLGRAPVIISDAWIEPPGLPWNSFSIRVPEARIKDIPAICQSRIDDAREMGDQARKAYCEFFQPTVFIDRMTRQCLRLQSESPGLLTRYHRTLCALSSRDIYGYFREKLANHPS